MVQTTGEPAPEVRFFRNGIPIEDSGDERVCNILRLMDFFSNSQYLDPDKTCRWRGRQSALAHFEESDQRRRGRVCLPSC